MKVIVVALLILFVASNQLAQVTRAQTPASKAGGPPAAPPGEGEEIGEDEVLRVTTNLVSIPVSVMDRDGRYIYDLRREDFRIYEDGAEQQISHFSSVEQPFTVVLLMDTSFSSAAYLGRIKETTNAFIAQLRPADAVLPVTFDGIIRPLLSKGTSNRALLGAAIEKMRTDEGNNGTRLYDAVDFAYQSLRRTRGRKAVILFTDGDDTWSRATLKSTLNDATELDALVYTIHYGSSPSNDYLSRLAEKTGGRFFQAADLETVRQSFDAVAEELRRQYSIGYYPKESARRGKERQLKVKVNRSNVGVRTRKSYIY
ncbi:MAG TPA: VWA domain-containing protein [Pyrinomonadaceae bacterium]|jgi:VWFA-related protein|nr:VWA domain-containing protein [Pyrinomonadaceae bacterium]